MGVIALATDALSEYGFEEIAEAVVKGLVKNGTSKATIRKNVEGYPISRKLKNKILSVL